MLIFHFSILIFHYQYYKLLLKSILAVTGQHKLKGSIHIIFLLLREFKSVKKSCFTLSLCIFTEIIVK